MGIKEVGEGERKWSGYPYLTKTFLINQICPKESKAIRLGYEGSQPYWQFFLSVGWGKERGLMMFSDYLSSTSTLVVTEQECVATYSRCTKVHPCICMLQDRNALLRYPRYGRTVHSGPSPASRKSSSEGALFPLKLPFYS